METKFKIIETEEYILSISNKQPIENYYYDTNINNIRHTGGAEYAIDSSIKQIIAYQPKNNAPELDLPLLPEIVVEDDVEKLAKESNLKREFPSRGYGEDEFIAGYKSATKVYSEEDLRKAFNAGMDYQEGGVILYPDEEGYIQSLKQPKTHKWFVAEMEYIHDDSVPYPKTKGEKLKTTITNGKTYLVGHYE
jgi:hypothetical protein